MSESRGYIDFEAAAKAIAGMSLEFKRVSQETALRMERVGWELRATFADTAKERCRIRRDMARYYRRPTLIHKGGKP